MVSCDWNLPPPLPCENLEFFLNLCLVLKQFIILEQYSTSLFLLQSFIYYFRKYNGKHRNCLYTDGRLLPPPGAITMVEVNLKRKFSSGEWDKGAAIKDNVIIVEKVGFLPNVWWRGEGTRNVCPSKYKVATKTVKNVERKMIFIQTVNISNSTL